MTPQSMAPLVRCGVRLTAADRGLVATSLGIDHPADTAEVAGWVEHVVKRELNRLRTEHYTLPPVSER